MQLLLDLPPWPRGPLDAPCQLHSVPDFLQVSNAALLKLVIDLVASSIRRSISAYLHYGYHPRGSESYTMDSQRAW